MGDLEHSSFDGDDEQVLEGFEDGEVLDDLEGQDGGYASSSDEEAEERAHPSISRDEVMDESLQCFEGHTDAVLSVAWSPTQPDLVATGGQDDRAYIWRVGQDAYDETAGSLGTIELAGHTDTVAALGFNSRGTFLATAGMDAVVKIWDVQTGDLRHTLEGPGEALDWLSWHPAGDVVLAGSEDFTLWMWNASSGACMQVMSGHRGAVSAGCFTPDGKQVVSVGGEGDCSLRVWNPKTGECSVVLQSGTAPYHEEGITCLDIHQDSAAVITGGMDGAVRMANIQTQRVLGSLIGHEDSVEVVGFCRQQPLAFTGSIDGKLIIWECSTLSQRGVCEHPAPITRAVWHPSQPLVFTACVDAVVRCWDLRTGALVRQYPGHRDGVQALCVSPDGSMLLSGSDDKTALVFMTAL